MRSRKSETLKQMKMRTQQSKICGTWKSNPKREIHSITGLSQKTRKSSNKQSNSHLKNLKKTNKTQSE